MDVLVQADTLFILPDDLENAIKEYKQDGEESFQYAKK